MRQQSNLAKGTAEKVVKDIRRATRKQYSAEEKIRIVLEDLGVITFPRPRPQADMTGPGSYADRQRKCP
jgi:hypothetical protein